MQLLVPTGAKLIPKTKGGKTHSLLVCARRCGCLSTTLERGESAGSCDHRSSVFGGMWAFAPGTTSLLARKLHGHSRAARAPPGCMPAQKLVNSSFKNNESILLWGALLGKAICEKRRRVESSYAIFLTANGVSEQTRLRGDERCGHVT